MNFSEDELERYQRQFVLEGFGPEAQRKLKRGKVLVVGAGGLGSPILYYLGAAGVGTLGIVDSDQVECSNLQRQILHNMERLGVNKAESAKKTILALNPNVAVQVYPYRLQKENVKELVAQYDVIVDAVDNFSTRFDLNDQCVLQKKPFVHGGVLGWKGQIYTYMPNTEQCCYRCIYEEVPKEGSVPDCKEMGLLGALPGMIGSMEAMEVLRILAGLEPMYAGKMFTFNGSNGKTRVIPFGKHTKTCPVCTKSRTESVNG